MGDKSTFRSVFISYARKDGRDLALRLQNDLKAVGYEVWLDTSNIGGGASWSRDIENAIEHCNVALALLSEGSYISEICRAEQILCLDKGKPVIPLLIQSTAKRPLHLYSLNYRDFSEHSQYNEMLLILLEDIETRRTISSAKRHIINTAPSLPINFVPRPNELEALRRVVIGDNTDLPTSFIALQGMGGIGKSVLAIALCHDEVVQAAFPDGVIWVTVGREPSTLVEQMQEVGKALGDPIGHYTSEQASINRLRTILPHKAALIVLDDVWDTRQIELFQADTPLCRILFTTRDASIALALGTPEIRLGVLAPDQAVGLLQEWAQRDDPLLSDIAKRLGYLPLALKLAGARLREGMSGSEWIRTFQHVSQIKLGRRSVDPKENLEICFDLSAEQLSQEDRLLYHTLGIFPEQVWIPQHVVARLWKQINPTLSEYDISELITDLGRLALVELRTENRLISLHDLLHDYTVNKLGVRYQATQISFLTTYNPKNIPWSQIPNDGYLYDHLTHHLVGAEQAESLVALFGNHTWMHSRFKDDSYTYQGYLSDLMTAWSKIAYPTVCQQIELSQEPIALADCLRYALIHTSVNSIAGNFPPQLVVQAIELEIWTIERAINTVSRVPNAFQKVEACTALLQMQVLGEEQRIQVCRMGLEATFAITNEHICANAIGMLTPFMSDKQLAETLAMTQAMMDLRARVEALAALIPHLPIDQKTETTNSALATASSIHDVDERSRAFVALLPYLPDKYFRKSLSDAKAIPVRGLRAEILSSLATYLPSDEKDQILTEALKDAQTTSSDLFCARALISLAPQLSGEQLSEALEIAIAIEDERVRVEALVGMIPHVTDEQIMQVFTAAQSINSKAAHAKILAASMFSLSASEKMEVSRILSEYINSIKSGHERINAIATLARYLDRNQQKQYVLDSLELLLEIPDEMPRIRALAVLIPFLSKEQIERVLKNVQKIVREDTRLEAHVLLAPYLSDDPEDITLRQSLVAIENIADDVTRVEFLSSLIPYLSDEQQVEAVNQATATIHLLQDDWDLERAITTLVPHLARTSVQQVLGDAMRIEVRGFRAVTLATLASHLSGEEQHEVIEQALVAAKSTSSDIYRGKALAILAPHLSDEQLVAALTQVIQMNPVDSEILLALISYVPGEQFAKILTFAKTLKQKSMRSRMIAVIANRLEGEARTGLLKSGIESALSIGDENERLTALTALLPFRSEINGLLDNIYMTIADYLLNNRHKTRQDMLNYCEKLSQFSPPVLPIETLASLANHITEISWEWEWQ